MANRDLPERQRLLHDVPPWAEDGSLFFITLNCATRGTEQLTTPTTAPELLEAARYYHDQRKWHIILWLLMPDHLHAILSFPRGVAMEDLFKNWKRFTARRHRVVWQDGFFDHRLRNAAEEDAKHRYIRHNPVRRNLCARPEDWPHQWHWTSEGLKKGGLPDLV